MAVTTKPDRDSEAEVKKGRGEGREWVSVGIRARGGSDSGGKGTPFVLSGKPTEGEAFNQRIITRVVPIPQPEKTGRGQHTRLEIQNTEAGAVGHKCKGGV